MRLLTGIFALSFFSLSAQDKGNFTFEIEANQIHYGKMDVYNRYLRDTTDFISSHFGDTYVNDTLKTSILYGVLLSYQPLSFMDFGIYGTYQSNQFGREYQRIHYVGGPPDTYALVDHEVAVKSNSYVIGISTNVYLNKLLHFEKYESKFLNRFQIAIGIKAGQSKNSFEVSNWASAAEIITENGINNLNVLTGNVASNRVSLTNWIGNVELKLGYRFIEKRFFSTVGIKVGYQFHSSLVYRNEVNSTFIFGSSKEDMRLNFSGLYYGIYLNVGKK